MNEAASALGKLARGKPKNYTPEEIAKRTARLALAREKRKRGSGGWDNVIKRLKRKPIPPDPSEDIGVPF